MAEVTTNEIMEFLREQMVTHEELNSAIGRLVTKQEFQEAISSLQQSIDHFAKKEETRDQEFTILQHKVETIGSRVHTLEQKQGMNV